MCGLRHAPEQRLALEEASRVSAAGPVKTLFRITLPAIRSKREEAFAGDD